MGEEKESYSLTWNVGGNKCNKLIINASYLNKKENITYIFSTAGKVLMLSDINTTRLHYVTSKSSPNDKGKILTIYYIYLLDVCHPSCLEVTRSDIK